MTPTIPSEAPGNASRAARLFLFATMLVALLFTVPSSRAQERCPWLNAATAAGILDASVSAVVTHPTGKSGEGLCEFLHKQNGDVREVRVTVELMGDPASSFPSYLARCGSDAKPLKAIGNEAVTCSVQAKAGLAQQVIGRVRNQAFIVYIHSTDKSLDDDAIAERARRIAELVAGNLF
jgi:hypothetical protein